jgi:hypothetical protein
LRLCANQIAAFGRGPAIAGSRRRLTPISKDLQFVNAAEIGIGDPVFSGLKSPELMPLPAAARLVRRPSPEWLR